MKKRDVIELSRNIADKLHARYEDKTLCIQYAWWMLENITGKNQAILIAKKDFDFTDQELETLDNWVKKQVEDKEPLQYILGTVPFDDIEILVEAPTLIPRPETEEMCYFTIGELQKLNNKKLNILDIGTGSGCIGLTLAHAFPESIICATDISKVALELANRNAKHNKISNIKFSESNVYDSLPENIKFDLIISNPPYITNTEFKDLDESVSKWEDKLALVANKNGLEIIEEIIKYAPKFLKQNNEIKSNKIPQLIIEIGYKQGPSVGKLFQDAGFVDIVIKKDLEGKDRFVIGRLENVAIYQKTE